MNNPQIEELGRIRQQLQQMLERLTDPAVGSASEPSVCWKPRVDIAETTAEFVLTVELPGVAKADIQLQAKRRILELFGTRSAPEAASFQRMEQDYGTFRRTFEFAHAIDVDGVDADFKRGVLTVRVPKMRAVRIAAVRGES